MYRRPGDVVSRLMAMGPREDRALVFLMTFCALAFVAQVPRLSREAHLSGQELNMLMGAALLGWVFIAPLFFYVLAALSHVVARLFGAGGNGLDARMVLFWALLASTPVMLLHGLVAGFIGPGAASNLVGSLWLAVLGWFWFTGLRMAKRDRA